jgi:cell division initiation protein
MSYTPVELRHVRLSRGLFGYRQSVVDELLQDVADSFENVWRERGELADHMEEFEKQLVEARRREELLAHTLVAAEQAASEVRESARREAEVVIAEAHQEARSIARGAQSEHARLAAEVRRMEALLRAALGMVEESVHPVQPQDGERVDQPDTASSETWPRREDTREFARPVQRVPRLPPEQEAQAG